MSLVGISVGVNHMFISPFRNTHSTIRPIRQREKQTESEGVKGNLSLQGNDRWSEVSFPTRFHHSPR